jgi:hypothetical protein
MPARDSYNTCKCSSCCAQNPLGIQWSFQGFRSHRQRIASEAKTTKVKLVPIPEPDTSSSSGEDHVRRDAVAELAADLFSDTINDNCSEFANQPDRLFTSRSQFQADLDVTHAAPLSPSIDDLVESVERLYVADSTEQMAAIPEVPTSSHSDLDCLATALSALYISTSGLGLSDESDSSNSEAQLRKKRESHRSTARALEILAEIEAKIRQIHQVLLDDPGLSTLLNLKSRVRTLSATLENVNRDTPTVKLRKQQVMVYLNALSGHLDVMVAAIEPMSAFEYSSGESHNQITILC